MDREELVYSAKLAEQAERYEDMVEMIKQVAKQRQQLTIEERNLLAVAYKNVIGSRRCAWRVISAKVDKLELCMRYKKVIEEEIRGIIEDVIGLLDGYVIPSEYTHDGRTFCYKMKGDYFRYLAEFSNSVEKSAAAHRAKQAYDDANHYATFLPPTHPIRLGLGLNEAVFYYEIMNNPERASAISKFAFDEAIAGLDALSEEDYKDSTLIMQLMRDGLTLWTSDFQPGDGDDELVGQYHA